MNPGNLWVHGQPPFELRMHWDPRSRKPLWRAGHEPRGEARASADWKSAVQQSGTLRYGEEVHGQPPFDFSHALGPGTAAVSWSAPVPWRYSGCAAIESARRLAHSKTWRAVGGSWKEAKLLQKRDKPLKGVVCDRLIQHDPYQRGVRENE